MQNDSKCMSHILGNLNLWKPQFHIWGWNVCFVFPSFFWIRELGSFFWETVLSKTWKLWSLGHPSDVTARCNSHQILRWWHLGTNHICCKVREVGCWRLAWRVVELYHSISIVLARVTIAYSDVHIHRSWHVGSVFHLHFVLLTFWCKMFSQRSSILESWTIMVQLGSNQAISKWCTELLNVVNAFDVLKL